MVSDIDRFELPGLNQAYFVNTSFPEQESKLSEALDMLSATPEDHRYEVLPGVARRLESYQFIGRCAGISFPTELEQRAQHALGMIIE